MDNAVLDRPTVSPFEGSVANPRRTRLVELPTEHREPQPAAED